MRGIGAWGFSVWGLVAISVGLTLIGYCQRHVVFRWRRAREGWRMSYNLLDERWIPVLYADGRWERVGIRKALEDAGMIREIAASNPMDRVAVLRFLIALVHWLDGASSGEWVDRIKNRERNFRLLGDGPRFYQSQSAKRGRAITDLLQEIPTGNNFWHFRHVTDGQEGMCARCCALGLLRLPLFCVSGLPDLKAGINGAPPIYAIALGRTLLQTLAANRMNRPLGTPAWEQPQNVPSDGNEVPLLNGLTLLARRVWLHEPTEPGGTCVACGGIEQRLIRTCEYDSAGPLQNSQWRDPHVIYQIAKDNRPLRAADLTSRFFKMDRPWTALMAGISQADNPAASCADRMFVVGFATDNAKNIDVWERTWPWNGSAAHDVAANLDAWETAGNKLGWRMRTRERFAECTVAVTGVRPQVECAVSADIRNVAQAPEQALQAATQAYGPMMAAVARSLSPGCTTRAVRRRREIAAVRPDMRAPASKAKRGKASKGASK